MMALHSQLYSQKPAAIISLTMNLQHNLYLLTSSRNRTILTGADSRTIRGLFLQARHEKRKTHETTSSHPPHRSRHSARAST